MAMLNNQRVYIYNIIILYTYTSSTAQGGGGRFKNRKRIGDTTQYWEVVWNMNFIVHNIWEESSQLTNSYFFRG